MSLLCPAVVVSSWCRVAQTALVSLQALLSAPEPSDPQDAEVARMYISDNAAWAEKARYWVDMYARAERPVDPKVEQVCNSLVSAFAPRPRSCVPR